jgi:hypothetical protein
MFPPRTPFFFRARLGSAEEEERGNLPVPPNPLPGGGAHAASLTIRPRIPFTRRPASAEE